MAQEVTPTIIRKLADEVRAHVKQNVKLTAHEFDRMLLAYELIDRIPTVHDPARGSHTRFRGRVRERIRHVLTQAGLALTPTGGGTYTVEDELLTGMKRLKGLTAEQERLASQRLGFIVMTLRNQFSGLAQIVGPERAEQLRDRAEAKINLLVQGWAQDLYFVCNGIPWPDELKPFVPENPARQSGDQRPKRQRGRKRA